MATASQALAPDPLLRCHRQPARIWLLARMTFREAVRKKMIWVVFLLHGVLRRLLRLGRLPLQGDVGCADRGAQFPLPDHLQSGGGPQYGLRRLHRSSSSPAVMGIFAAIGTIAGEVDGGTFQAILPKPIRALGSRARQVARLRDHARALS